MRLNPRPTLTLVLAAAAAIACAPAWADRSDRSRPMVIEADRPGTVDLQRQVVVFNGDVVISQGTMQLRADRVEMRETADGYRAATASGTPTQPATWRQRRDGVDETVEGSGQRIEFDSRADTLRLVGNAVVRRLRGGVVADEVTGGTIVWDNTSEVFKVEGGATTPSNPGGRVRAVLSPRAVPAGSAPDTAAPLTPSRGVGERR